MRSMSPVSKIGKTQTQRYHQPKEIINEGASDFAFKDRS